jgi:tartrate dehydrogenase/decarboxylase/D-malate dehydrogenase
MSQRRIAVIPGDGVGVEVVAAARLVVDAAIKASGRMLYQWEEFPWSCDFYNKTGQMIPKDALKILARYDAVLLGAVGLPDVPDEISVNGLVHPIRQGFRQYINYRPIQLLPGIESPLRNKTAEDIDIIFIRENSEGEFTDIGGMMYEGTPNEIAMQCSVFSRRGIERTARFAFEIAKDRPKRKVTSITKLNAMPKTMTFWDRICREVAEDYPAVEFENMLVDAAAARMVTRPETLDVMVGSNLFGDILTDLGGAIQGGLGTAPGANLNPERDYPSMFEPIHGSAPKYRGQGIADPLGAIRAAALMADWLGDHSAAKLITDGICSVMLEGRVRTKDLGGSSSTSQFAEAISKRVLELVSR